MPLSIRDKVLEVSRVFCEAQRRREGVASRLMARVCEHADNLQQALMLSVAPTSDSPVSADDLASWYSSFDFGILQQATDTTPAIMVRYPKQAAA
jgi:predicted GNAT superfamily acetyltransferase